MLEIKEAQLTVTSNSSPLGMETTMPLSEVSEVETR